MTESLCCDRQETFDNSRGYVMMKCILRWSAHFACIQKEIKYLINWLLEKRDRMSPCAVFKANQLIKKGKILLFKSTTRFLFCTDQVSEDRRWWKIRALRACATCETTACYHVDSWQPFLWKQIGSELKRVRMKEVILIKDYRRHLINSWKIQDTYVEVFEHYLYLIGCELIP